MKTNKTFKQQIPLLILATMCGFGHNNIFGMDRYIYKPKETKEELRSESLRAGKEAFEWIIEKEKQSRAKTIESCARGYLERKKIQNLTSNCSIIQSAFKGVLERKNVLDHLRTPTLTLQCFLRGSDVQKKHRENNSEMYLNESMDFVTQERLKSFYKQTSDQKEKYMKTRDEKPGIFFSGINSVFAHKALKNEFQENWKTISTKNNSSIKPVLLVSLHGTFADPTESGIDENAKTSDAILAYCQHLADKHGHDVDLLMFQWTAANTEESRKESGLKLAEVIIEYMKKNDIKKDSEIFLFSVTHSWGGAVMQYAAREVHDKTGIDFDCGVQTACPVPHVKETSGTYYHFKKLFQFYTDTDLTQALGSTGTFSEMLGRKMPLIKDQDHLVWNVRVQNDGQTINHINIKWVVMEKIVPLLKIMQKHYSYQLDLDANIVPQTTIDKLGLDKESCIDLQDSVLVAIREEDGNLIEPSKEAQQFDLRNKELYNKIYGSPIGKQGNVLTRFLGTLAEIPYAFFNSKDAYKNEKK